MDTLKETLLFLEGSVFHQFNYVSCFYTGEKMLSMKVTQTLLNIIMETKALGTPSFLLYPVFSFFVPHRL